ncbi:hypothetical protein PRIPAC_86978, partial [Pristionchus pacificus]|uniref:Uncharacterized protein n=1 Tax=Pristionchus pacificus TaxID=54126 RepID=A0A2A6BM70_PRIPA
VTNVKVKKRRFGCADTIQQLEIEDEKHHDYFDTTSLESIREKKYIPYQFLDDLVNYAER